MATDKEGRTLPDNLFQNRRNRTYRYKNISGKFTTVRDEHGKPADYELAVKIADAANMRRDKATPSSLSIQFWITKYIDWAEKQDPELPRKRSWSDRKSELNKFADEFSGTNINKLKLSDIRPWWESLTYDQQHNRRSAHSRFFQWAMSNDVCSINPFSTSDHAPRLMLKPKPKKKRSPLELDDFLKMFHSEHIKKYPHVRIAMGISLVTGMREEDICLLKFSENIIDGRLCKTIGKSVGQRGAIKASHHSYDLSTHTLLKPLIDQARELSLKHRRCPFILSYHPRGSQLGDKEHIAQVRPKKLSRDFSRVRDLCGIEGLKGKNPPTFHEIKGLYIKIGLQHYAGDLVQSAASHVNMSTTLAYPANHKPEFKEVGVIFTPEMLGNSF